MLSRLRLMWCLLVTLTTSLFAQDDPKFVLKASLEPATAAPGEAVMLVLRATTAAGWHAYGTLETGNIPVSLDTAALELTGLERAGEADIPGGLPEVSPYGTTYPLPESFRVTVPLKVAAGATGALRVAGGLGYQICMQGSCEQPNTAAFEATGEVDAAAPASSAAVQEPPPPIPVPGLGTVPGLMLGGDEKVAVTAKFEPATARAGEVTTLVLDVNVIDGWHAYGTKETGQIPVEYAQDKQDVGSLAFEGDPVVPPGDPVEVFDTVQYQLPHHFEVRQAFRVPTDAAPREVTIGGVLDYQICNEVGCDPPAEAEYEATLTIEAGAARAAQSEAPKATDHAGDDEVVVDPDDPFGSWWALILASIGGGLFALAMPCTYPMIPITFSFFTKQAEKAGGNVLPLTITYGLGIIAMFVFVGVALSAVIIDVVNHWATNAVIGAMFFFFAAVLFGWVNLNPPQFLQRLATKAQMSAAGAPSGGSGLTLGGLSGVFFMGATLVLTSFTCTAPIVGSLIGGIAKHGTAKVAVGMGIFGLTMAIPFMALSLAPTKVKAMPKSGEWMETLKISLGFVELAAAFKFVSMVDIYFGWDALPRELFLMLWAAVFGLWALYLFGVLRKAGTPSMGVGNGRMAGGMIVTLLATYFLFGAMGNRMDKIMTGFVPAYSNRIVMKGEGSGPKVEGHVIVKDDPQKAIEVAKAEDKLVLYNFTGFN
ncbi:MAG: cytochrome c biogenesis protein CcdA [Planctomycetota bacterium]|nr:cytochrome c biogenesis protein CcdA [Planctomycetota bacterium]